MGAPDPTPAHSLIPCCRPTYLSDAESSKHFRCGRSDCADQPRRRERRTSLAGTSRLHDLSISSPGWGIRRILGKLLHLVADVDVQSRQRKTSQSVQSEAQRVLDDKRKFPRQIRKNIETAHQSRLYLQRREALFPNSNVESRTSLTAKEKVQERTITGSRCG